MSFSRLVLVGAVVGAMVFGISGESGAQIAHENAEYDESRIIVEFEEGIEPSEILPLNRASDAETIEILPDEDAGVVEISEDTGVSEALEEYGDSPLIGYAEPDYIIEAADISTPNDPEFSRQYSRRNTGQTVGKSGSDIEAMGAWQALPSVVMASVSQGSTTIPAPVVSLSSRRGWDTANTPSRSASPVMAGVT